MAPARGRRPFIAAVLGSITLAVADCGGGSGASQGDRDKALAEARVAFRQVEGTGQDLSRGPCIAESLPGLSRLGRRRRPRSAAAGRRRPGEPVLQPPGRPDAPLRRAHDRGQPDPGPVATMDSARIMGIVNVTPDSFSDGGEFLDPGRAIAHGRRLAAEGVDALDVGGESTRPGAEGVDAAEELRRVAPVVEALADGGALISIDTSKVSVAEAAVDAGATIVNDVTALRAEPALAALCADRGCELVLMHMLGDPRTMQEDPTYDDVVDDVKAFLAKRVEFAVGAGARRGADLDRPRDRLRQDGRAQPRAPSPPRRACRARAPDRLRLVPQELSGQAQRG